MKAPLILLCLSFLIFNACSFELPFYTHEFRHISSLKYDVDASTWIFADLKGDGYEHLIKVFPQMKGSAINVLNHQGKSVSQINIAEGEINCLKVFTNPVDRSRWLIYSINDGSRVYLGATKYIWEYPLKRHDMRFEAYPRNDNLMNVPAYTWNAALQAIVLEDIDGDGKLELVALAVDGYSANPRGLVAYDFETGAQKWFVPSPACFHTAVFDDFDGDGYKEFVLGSVSLNNTELSFNGLDDKNGYLAVIDRFGRLVLTEQLMSGLSEIFVQSADVDQDGTKEIFALLLKRGSESSANGVLRLSFDGQRLIRHKELVLPGNLESLSYLDFLMRLDSSASYKILLNNRQNGLQLYDDKLDLVESGSTGINLLYAVDDFRQIGRQELLVRNNNDHFLLLNRKLKPIAGFKNPYPDKRSIMARLVHGNSESKPNLVVSCESAISFYEVSHIPLLVYLYRLIDAYALWLSILFMAIIIRVMIALRHRDKALIVATDKCNTGFILVNHRARILFANKLAINLALKVYPNSSLESLNDCFPPLSEALQNFRISHVDYEDLRIEHGGEQFRVHIERLPGFRKRIIISLTAPAPDVDSEMLVWAETARRLSHHVRRHITNVILAMDPLEDGSSPIQKEYLQIARSEIEKIRIFTHAFQRFTEMHKYELNLIDVVPHVEHAIQQVRLPESISLIKNYSLKSMNAYIEPIRFEEALVNTLNNATEAMPQGGTLHISIRHFALHKSPQGNLSVLVEVEDSGKGIPAKYMQEIWKPFFTTNQSGTGIGIPETKKILDSMGGILDIQSEEGVGTTVSLWLKGESDV